MTEKGEKILVIIASVFLAAALCVMWYIRKNTSTEDFTESTEEYAEGEQESRGSEESCFISIDGTEADIIIPLPNHGTKDTLRVEESLKDMTLEVILQDVEEEYYLEHKVQGNKEKIAQVSYRYGNKESELVFVLKDIYTADVQIKEDSVLLRLCNPAEQYDRMVVLEGGSWEREVLDSLEKKDIKGLSEGDVVTANRLRADFFVSMSVDTWASEDEIIIYYNDDYYIPKFDSRHFAELLQEAFAKRYGSGNVRIERTEEGELAEATMPAVMIECRLGVPDAGEPGETDREKINAENGMIVADVLTRQYQEVEE